MGLVSDISTRFKKEFIGQVIATGSGSLLILVLSRLLKPDAYGLLFLAISIFSVGQVFSKLGIAGSAGRYIAEYRERNSEQIPHILRQSLKYNLITISVVVFLFAIVDEQLATVLGEPELIPLLTLGVLYIAFSSLTAYSRAIAQSFEDISLSATINALNQGGRLIFGVGFFFLEYGLLGILGGFILSAVLASIFGLLTIYRRYYHDKPISEEIEPGLSKRMLQYSFPLTLTGLSGRIDKQVDTIMIGYFLTPTATGYYVLAKQISSVVQMPANALGFSISPTYGKQKAANKLTLAARMFERSLIYTLLLYVPAATGILILAEPAIVTIFGSSYLGAVPVLQILSAFIILSAITNITDLPLDYMGKAKYRSIARGITASLNAVLNLILIPSVGVAGAAIATVITHTLYVSYKLYLISLELPLELKKIIGDVLFIIIISGCMAIVVWLISNHLSGPFSLGLAIVVGVIIWLILSLITGVLSSQEIRQVFS